MSKTGLLINTVSGAVRFSVWNISGLETVGLTRNIVPSLAAWKSDDASTQTSDTKSNTRTEILSTPVPILVPLKLVTRTLFETGLNTATVS